MSERRVDVSTAPMDVAARETNRVLKNTYMLLGMTLAFSAVTATISMVLQLPTFMYLVFVLVGFGLLFVVNRMADSAKGLPAIFAFTGVMGAALGPLLNVYLALPNGPMVKKATDEKKTMVRVMKYYSLKRIWDQTIARGLGSRSMLQVRSRP